jgi:hypothetical protein
MPFVRDNPMKMTHKFAICILCPLLLASIALGQQEYVGRYDLYTGYMYLNSPGLSLGETGFHTQFGTNPANWYSMGFDFSTGAGDTTLTPNMLKSSLQQQITGALAPLKSAGIIPAGYEPAVPEHSRTQTYAMGPQVNYRHFRRFTLSIHPDVGAIHEDATPLTAKLDPISTALVGQLAPSGTKRQWIGFYGFGGGVDFNVMRHFGLRVTADLVHDNLFADLVTARNTMRFSVGPIFHMGKNVSSPK